MADVTLRSPVTFANISNEAHVTTYLVGDEGWKVKFPLVPLLASSPLLTVAASGICPCQDVVVHVPGFSTAVVELFAQFILGNEIRGDMDLFIPLCELCHTIGVKMDMDSQLDLKPVFLEAEREREVDNKTLHCPMCNIDFRSKIEEQHHMFSAHIAYFHCEKCPAIFQNRHDLNEHLSLHFPEKRHDKNTVPSSSAEKVESSVVDEHSMGDTDTVKRRIFKKFKCELCVDHFRTWEGLQKHLATVHSGTKSLQCEECQRTFWGRSQYLSHMEAHKRKLKPLDNEDNSIEEEDQMVLETDQIPEKPFPCPDCDRSFKHHRHLVRHSIVHKRACSNNQDNNTAEEDEKPMSVSNQQTEKMPFPCQYCDRSFKLRVHLMRHSVVHKHAHRNNQDTSTVEDDKSVSVSDHSQKQRGQTRFPCPDCGRSFRLRIHLRRHSVTHNPSLSFNCQVCDKRFLIEANFLNHMSLHNAAGAASKKIKMKSKDTTSPKQFYCYTCKTKFAEESLFQLHMRKEHAVDRPFRCNHCLKVFANYAWYKTHVKAHGSRKETCKICHNVFSTPSLLRKHMEAHAKGTTRLKPVIDPAVPRTSPVIKLQRICICTVCSKQFKSQDELTRHVQSHTDENLKCPVCEQPFKYKHSLVIHLKWKHKDQNLSNSSLDKQEDQLGKSGLPEATEDMETSNVCPETDMQRKCSACDATFNDEELYMEHMRTEHPMKVLKQTDAEEKDSKKKIMCKHCGKIFIGTNGIKIHARRAHPEFNKMLSCDSCGKKYYRMKALLAHKAKNHSRSRSRKRNKRLVQKTSVLDKKLVYDKICGVCHTCIWNSDELPNHILSTHAIAYYKCQFCDEEFHLQSLLASHLKTVHPTMNAPTVTAPIMLLMCNSCGEKQTDAEKFNQHLHDHEKTIAANGQFLKCKICAESCTKYSGLRYHILGHYTSCQICSIRFPTPAQLEKHVQKEHTDLSGKSENMVSEQHSGESSLEDCQKDLESHSACAPILEAHNEKEGDIVMDEPQRERVQSGNVENPSLSGVQSKLESHLERSDKDDEEKPLSQLLSELESRALCATSLSADVAPNGVISSKSEEDVTVTEQNPEHQKCSIRTEEKQDIRTETEQQKPNILHKVLTGTMTCQSQMGPNQLQFNGSHVPAHFSQSPVNSKEFPLYSNHSPAHTNHFSPYHNMLPVCTNPRPVSSNDFQGYSNPYVGKTNHYAAYPSEHPVCNNPFPSYTSQPAFSPEKYSDSTNHHPTNTVHTCEFCGQNFISEVQLAIHRLDVHVLDNQK